MHSFSAEVLESQIAWFESEKSKYHFRICQVNSKSVCWGSLFAKCRPRLVLKFTFPQSTDRGSGEASLYFRGLQRLGCSMTSVFVWIFRWTLPVQGNLLAELPLSACSLVNTLGTSSPSSLAEVIQL